MREEEPYEEPLYITQEEPEPSPAKQAVIAIAGLGFLFALPAIIDRLSFSGTFRRGSR